MNRRAQLICAWTGPVLAVLFLVGAVVLGRFIPPWVHPTDTPQEVAAIFAQHADRIRIGALLTIISMSLIAPWGVSTAAQTRRTEGSFPILTWPPFSVWTAAVALSIFLDPSERPVYPRWVAYLNIWVTILFVPAGLMAFFKHGAFSWAGLMSLYIPVAIFFVWLVVMTTLTIKNINRGLVHEPSDVDASPERLALAM